MKDGCGWDKCLSLYTQVLLAHVQRVYLCKSLPGTSVPQEHFALTICSARMKTHYGLSGAANPAEVGKYVHSHFTDG